MITNIVSDIAYNAFTQPIVDDSGHRPAYIYNWIDDLENRIVDDQGNFIVFRI